MKSKIVVVGVLLLFILHPTSVIGQSGVFFVYSEELSDGVTYSWDLSSIETSERTNATGKFLSEEEIEVSDGASISLEVEQDVEGIEFGVTTDRNDYFSFEIDESPVILLKNSEDIFYSVFGLSLVSIIYSYATEIGNGDDISGSFIIPLLMPVELVLENGTRLDYIDFMLQGVAVNEITSEDDTVIKINATTLGSIVEIDKNTGIVISSVVDFPDYKVELELIVESTDENLLSTLATGYFMVFISTISYYYNRKRYRSA